jgi:hypothetical protein
MNVNFRVRFGYESIAIEQSAAHRCGELCSDLHQLKPKRLESENFTMKPFAPDPEPDGKLKH